MERYSEYLNSIGIQLSNKQLMQFQKFYELLVEKNKVMNLTGITEYDEVVEKHFIDSIAIASFAKLEGKIIDLGTGAGFPGIPLKIVYPDVEFVLLDSLNKRIKFLDDVIDELELEKVTTVHGRAEDFAQKDEYREKFDFCVSRAVANLSTLSEYSLPFVKIGGEFISYKSGEIEDELVKSKKVVKILGGSVKEVNIFELPNNKNSRSFVSIKKDNKTLKKYPRKAGLPSKEPLN